MWVVGHWLAVTIPRITTKVIREDIIGSFNVLYVKGVPECSLGQIADLLREVSELSCPRIEVVEGYLIRVHSEMSYTAQPVLAAKYGPDHRGVLAVYRAVPGLGRGQGCTVAPYDPLVMFVLGII